MFRLIILIDPGPVSLVRYSQPLDLVSACLAQLGLRVRGLRSDIMACTRPFEREVREVLAKFPDSLLLLSGVDAGVPGHDFIVPSSVITVSTEGVAEKKGDCDGGK